MNFFDDLLNPETAQRHVTQGSEQWDALRCGRFTASQIYRLMTPVKRDMTESELKARPKSGVGSSSKLIYSDEGLSDAAITYINQKVAETLTGQIKAESYAFPLVWGKDTEPLAVEHFETVTGLKCEEIGFCQYTDHAGGSPDRDIPEDDSFLEVKSPWQSENQIGYLMLTDHYDLKRMHPDYYWQVQSNLVFTNRSKAHFVTFDPRFKDDKLKMQHLIIPVVPADQDLIRLKIALAVKEKLSIIQTLLA